MILLVSGATATVRRYADSPYLGHLLTPANGNSITTLLGTGLPIACDNAAFTRFDAAAYRSMLREVAPYRDAILWVTAPDVVADARATLLRLRLWLPTLRYYGLRVALVAQDGQELMPVPWAEIDCLFIGGSTKWKESRHAMRLIQLAKHYGKQVHLGRVNSERREDTLIPFGADSMDGGKYSMFPDTYIPAALRRLARVQHSLPGVFYATNNRVTGRNIPSGHHLRKSAPGRAGADLRPARADADQCALFDLAGSDQP